MADTSRRRDINALNTILLAICLGALSSITFPAASRAQDHAPDTAPLGPMGPATASKLGESTVSGATGAVTLRIPIDVPPGEGGLTPSLALTYSSQSKLDGAYGVGWSLPLGEIRCSARFGAPDYAACAHYELDGQLLIPAGSNVYHTLVESFRTVT